MVTEETIKAFINATQLRAKAYVYFFEEIAKELGPEKAKKLCSRVTYRLGLDKAGMIPESSRRSAQGIAQSFVADPVGRVVFGQQVVSAADDEAVIEMKHCPLVDMWKEMGIKDDMISTLCDFAHRIDYGNIEGAGFKLEFTSRIACQNTSCVLRIYK